MKARRRLDRVLLLVAALLVLTLVAVLIVKSLEDSAKESGLISLDLNETVTPAEMPELEVHNKSEEALLEVDHFGRDLPELIDIYPAPTVAPMPVTEPTVETTAGEPTTVTEDSVEVPFTTTTVLQLTDYEIFLNPPGGSHDVDLTLYVSPTGGVNLRSEASTDSLAKKVIAYGSSVHVIRIEGSWVEVKLSGGERGYLVREYLQAIKPPVLETSATTQPTTAPTQAPIQNQTTVAPAPTQAPPATVAPSSGNFLLGIANPNPNYVGRPVQVEDRAVLEGLVMGEFGSNYTGAVLVAQAIRDTMILSGVYNTATIARNWGYHASVSNYVNETTKRAVAFVFDEGGSAVQHSIYYFYAAHRVTSSWHESQRFVVEYGGCRFFSR